MDGENARHAIRVLRFSPGDRLVVCDGAGIDYFCEVKRVGRDGLELFVISIEENQSEPTVEIYLFTSLLKADKMEYVVQKAVELGVFRIYPFESVNGVARIGGDGKINRLVKIAESAAKQSGRGIIPSIDKPIQFNSAIDMALSLKADVVLVAHEKAKVGLKKILRDREKIKTAVIFIGPEGGFSDEEIKQMEIVGIKPFLLGKCVLRAETAAVAALACVMYDLGE